MPPTLTSNKLEIELLKKDVEVVTNLFNKFDVTIDKLQEIASTLSKMVSMQEQRIEVQENTTKEIQNILELRRMEHNTEIKELHTRISNVNVELTGKIEESEKAILAELKKLREELSGEKVSLLERLSAIEGWKWMLTGVFAVVVWLLTQIDITQFFT
jgi:predicted  nucleic acid-binding Zn-ribbon protein